MAEPAADDDATLGAVADADATLAASQAGEPAPDHEIARGTVVGRYVVLAELGAGGMGVVLAAYDPELDRKVALKLVRSRGPEATGGSEGGTRLVREAQALARLSHPNVVAVHDVGTQGDRVWIAMELVDGRTLVEWRRERARSWREVLDVVLAAGRGVAAAHAAELLHRDLKPGNVMVGHDGRVRVMDFGLARTSIDRSDDLAHASTVEKDTKATPELAALAMPVTRAGSLLGTPAYMAPEQFRGAGVGPATDQFALCVTAWEALFGERPFVGDTVVELAAVVIGGRVRPPPRGASVPGWLRSVLERGLATDPAARWPSIDALVNALARGRDRARKRRMALAALGVVLVAGTFAAAGEIDERRRIAACEAEGASIAEIWNADARANVAQALEDTGVGLATVTAEKAVPWIDRQAEAWRSARTEACLDGEVRERWDADALERSRWCFDDRKMELDALVTQLSRADAKVVQYATTAAARLTAVDGCRDRDRLALLPALPTERREEVRALRTDLSRVAAFDRAGRYDAGIALGESVLARAEALGWPPLVAAAGVRLGRLHERTSHHAEAEAAQQAAYFVAARAGALEEAADAASGLAYTVGYSLARHAEGRTWAQHAEVAIAALGEGEGLRTAGNLSNLAAVDGSAGAYEQAKALHERALAIREEALGPDHLDVAVTLNNLANVHRATGAFEEARVLHERALAIREEALGSDHPDVATSLNNLATVHDSAGQYAQAQALYERALAIREKSLGADHADVATTLHNLATVHQSTGAYEPARALLERALAIREKALGPDHPAVAASLANLARIHAVSGEYERARALHERALAIREKSLGADHPDVATSLNNLANVHRATGAHAQARALHERALAIREKLGADHPDVAMSLVNLADIDRDTREYARAGERYALALAILEKAFGTEHPDLAHALVGLAEVALAERRSADAIAPAERAVRLREAGRAPAEALADARFALARALVDAGRDRERAMLEATKARDGWRDAKGSEKALAEVEAWLARLR